MFVPHQRYVDAFSLQRYEYKYLIPPELVDPIISFIRPYCSIDPYSARAKDNYYPLKSLYLDSAGYRTYWDVREEVSSRFKLRIRAYDNDDTGLVKFEIKRRFKDIFLKTTVSVHSVAWPFLLEQPSCQLTDPSLQTDNPALQEFIRLALRIHAEPKMLVAYERLAFKSNIDRYVRISIDRRICHQPKYSYDFNAQRENWIYNDGFDSSGEIGPRAILELKWMTPAPVWFVDMVHRFGLVRRGFSKYCTAVARTLNQNQVVRELFQSKPANGNIGKGRL
jgi:SPX domain protein involved in polyphosphate accumulation